MRQQKHRAKKWEPVFRIKRCDNKNLRAVEGGRGLAIIAWSG
jgi:hypothetical protein